jgi:hypothetical protein
MLDDNNPEPSGDEEFPDLGRLAERYEAAAIALRDGFAPRTALKALAFRREEVTPQQLDAIEAELVRRGRFERRHGRFAGRHGRSVEQFRTSVVVPPTRAPYAELVTTLAAADRLVLLDFAHAQAEREVAEGRAGIWVRISTALAAAERDATPQAGDSGQELPRTPLRHFVFSTDRVESRKVTQALDELVAALQNPEDPTDAGDPEGRA